MLLPRNLASIVILLLVTGGCAMPKDRFLISYYSTSNTEKLHDESATEALAKHGGRLVVAPIANLGPIENNATPDYLSRLPGNYISIAVFESKTALNEYLKVNPNGPASADVVADALVVAKIFKPMPLMQDMPVIGSVEHREEPSFILLNGISMNSMLNPLTIIRMTRYMAANTSKLEKQGVFNRMA